MLTRKWTRLMVLVPGTLALTLSAGCASTSSDRDRQVESQRETPIVAVRNDTRAPANPDPNRAEMASNAEPDTAYADVTPAHARTVAAAPAPQGEPMESSNPPPLTKVEIPAPAPRDGEFWVNGHWRGETGQYVWQTGRVEQYRAGVLYHPANWIPSARGWEYTQEYWQ